MIQPTRATRIASLALAGTLTLVPGAAGARVWSRVWHLLQGEHPPTAPAQALAEDAATRAPSWPQILMARHGQTSHFKQSHVKGHLGDRLTRRRLTKRGYRKLPSKYDGVRGIDGVYVKQNAQGEIIEIRLVESKVDKSRLNPGPPPQMSDEWIRQVCGKMLEQGSPEAADTARLLLAHLDSPKLKRELWHHDLASGQTQVRPVDAHGKPQDTTESWTDQLIPNELARQCAQAALACE